MIIYLASYRCGCDNATTGLPVPDHCPGHDQPAICGNDGRHYQTIPDPKFTDTGHTCGQHCCPGQDDFDGGAA